MARNRVIRQGPLLLEGKVLTIIIYIANSNNHAPNRADREDIGLNILTGRAYPSPTIWQGISHDIPFLL